LRCRKDLWAIVGQKVVRFSLKSRDRRIAAVKAYDYARRLKTLEGLTPYEFICKAWTKEPARFTLNPIDQMPGLNI